MFTGSQFFFFQHFNFFFFTLGFLVATMILLVFLFFFYFLRFHISATIKSSWSFLKQIFGRIIPKLDCDTVSLVFLCRLSPNLNNSSEFVFVLLVIFLSNKIQTECANFLKLLEVYYLAMIVSFWWNCLFPGRVILKLFELFSFLGTSWNCLGYSHFL